MLTLLFEQLTPGERLGELLFGLIMTLTFTLGAGVMVGTSEGASSSLLYATLGCNVAWGIIDGALLLLGRMFDRGRLARLGDAIAGASNDHARFPSSRWSSMTCSPRSRRSDSGSSCTATSSRTCETDHVPPLD